MLSEAAACCGSPEVRDNSSVWVVTAYLKISQLGGAIQVALCLFQFFKLLSLTPYLLYHLDVSASMLLFSYGCYFCFCSSELGPPALNISVCENQAPHHFLESSH